MNFEEDFLFEEEDEDEDELDVEELKGFTSKDNKYYGSAEYLHKSRKTKQKYLWAEITKDTTSWAFPGILEQGKIFISD